MRRCSFHGARKTPGSRYTNPGRGGGVGFLFQFFFFVWAGLVD